MTATHAEQLVDGYLGRLELELHDLPPERRREIVDEIRGHIAEERRTIRDESDTDLLNLLDRLGDPSEIAAEARGDRAAATTPSENRLGVLEILAVLFTVLIWPVGVILLWASPAWSTRQKLIGTLVPPGGYPGIFLLFNLLSLVLLQSATVTQCGSGPGMNVCPWEWSQALLTFAFLGVTIVWLVAPIAVAIYLVTRLTSPTTRTAPRA